MVKANKQHTWAMITISLTTIFWGIGFVISDTMLANGMPSALINMFRFVIAALLIGIIFHKRFNINKQTLVLGLIGGVLLFFAFELQLSALNYTTAAQNGFFTASYVIFVPLMVWLTRKKKPTIITWAGIALAIAGFIILNLASESPADNLLIVKDKQWLGNLMTIGCAVIFAMQIALSDWALHERDVDAISFTFLQLASAAVCFVIYFVIFHLKSTDWTAINWQNTWYAVLFVALLGTTFAYPAQINAQKFLSAPTVSLIMALEAVIGALASVLIGYDNLSWNLVVGGTLVTSAIIVVEYLPEKVKSFRKKRQQPADNNRNNTETI